MALRLQASYDPIPPHQSAVLCGVSFLFCFVFFGGEEGRGSTLPGIHVTLMRAIQIPMLVVLHFSFVGRVYFEGVSPFVTKKLLYVR